MDRELNVGDHVIYFDPRGVERDALVTRVWQSIGGLPGCNLVFVSGDEARDDPYGRQLERATSIVHRSVQPAAAFCWDWPTK